MTGTSGEPPHPYPDGPHPDGPDPWHTWLTRRERAALHLPGFRRAAVLVALTGEADPRVLLTVRSAALPTHAGQISFPGGSLNPGEGVEAAALREAWEEVGLEPAGVLVLGQLDDVFTPAGFHVTPVLARISSQPRLTLTAEVTQLLMPALSELRAAPTRHDVHTLPGGDTHRAVRYAWQGHDIWGMTARVLEGLLHALPGTQ